MILLGKDDIFNGVTVKSANLEIAIKENFEIHLQESLAYWKENRRRGIWMQVNIKDSELVPILARHGFEFHHAQKEFVTMIKWLPKSPCTLPRYAHTNIGVGGLVEDGEGRILMMREKKGGLYRGWKFPGGLSDPGEDIMETAAREVREETGIKSVGCSVFMFRQTKTTAIENVGDIYFVCSMKLEDETKKEIIPCPQETEEAGWFTREEINAMDSDKVHGFIKRILERFDLWKEGGKKGLRKTRIEGVHGSIFVVD